MIEVNGYTDNELRFIADNYQDKTNREIADYLHKNVRSISYVARKMGLVKQPHKLWTEEENKFLTENYMNMTSEELAVYLDRTVPSINARCKELNLIKHDVWTEEEISYLIEHYMNMEHSEIGEYLGRSEGAVRAKCFDLDLYKKELPWSKEELDFVKENYMEMTTSEISEILHRTTNAIKLKAERMGMKKSPYHCNYHFFENIDTEEKAYWLGFITADGWASKNELTGSAAVGIELQYGDIKHLKKFNISLDGNYKITDRWRKCLLSSDSKLHHMCNIRIFSLNMYNDLSKYGISDKKTYTVKFPDIDKNLYRHYVRGLFDADGCFCLSNKRFGVSYITASEELKDDFIKCLRENGIEVSDYKSINEFNTVIYRPTINKNDQKLKFLNWIYEDSTIYLDRKYKKYLKAKEKYESLCGLAAQK